MKPAPALFLILFALPLFCAAQRPKAKPTQQDTFSTEKYYFDNPQFDEANLPAIPPKQTPPYNAGNTTPQEEKTAVADLVAKIKAIEATYWQTVKPLDDEMMVHILATQKAIVDGSSSKFEASKKSALQMLTRQEAAYLKAKLAFEALGMNLTQEPLSSMTRLHKTKESLRETVSDMEME